MCLICCMVKADSLEKEQKNSSDYVVGSTTATNSKAKAPSIKSHMREQFSVIPRKIHNTITLEISKYYSLF